MSQERKKVYFGDFHENLRKIRKVQRMSQVEFGELVDVSRVFICNMENNNRWPSIHILYKMVDRLSISLENLYEPKTFQEIRKLVCADEGKQRWIKKVQQEGNYEERTEWEYDKLVKMRRKKGFTQERLSKESGICRSHICCIERGQYWPSVDTLKSLAKVLGCKVYELF